MNQVASYKKPPITDVVIELRFSKPITQKLISKFVKELRKHYELCEELLDKKLDLNFDKNEYKTRDSRFSKLSSLNFTRQCIIKDSSLAVMQLAPYSGWDDFINRFERDYSLLRKIAGFVEIIRIGTRYINRIDIPFHENRVYEHEYLNLYPKYPDEFGLLSKYAIQTELELSDLKSNLRINSAVVPSPIVGHLAIVFDQDIARVTNLPQKLDGLLEYLNEVRLEKNKVFEMCITDKTRELFNL